MFIDSHCHLDFPDLIAREAEILAAMTAARVTHAMCIGVKLETIDAVLALAERHDNLFATVGVHPDGADVGEPDEATLLRLARHPKVRGIGETGLDYYWHKDAPEWQRQRFRTHIRAARSCGLPLVIHTRDSAADTLRVMREEQAGEVGGVMHCFTETLAVAEEAIELGFHISFSGIVTFRSAKALKEVAAAIPLERMLIETDSPYLAPVPYRGKTNQPAYVVHVAEEIARLRSLSVEEVGAITTRNFRRVFLKEN